jgi:transcriptional regulator with XRE-family HTH domain
MTDVLRKAIAESGMTYKALERETGVKRQSLMKFARGEQSLRLDMADKLAAYFSIEVRQRSSSSVLKDHRRRRGG